MHKGPGGGNEQLSFYRKMAELQEKLRKSEEERSHLEIKFSDLVRGGRVRSDERLSILRHEYANLLEREKKRRARNEKVMESLENIDRHTAVINAKTEHLKLMRRQFDAYMLKMYPEFKLYQHKEEVKQCPPFEPVPSNYKNSQSTRQWHSPYLSNQQRQDITNDYLPRPQEPIYSFQRREESIYNKPASSPLNLSRHEPTQDDSDQGSLLWTSINDVRPLNLTMEDSSRLSAGMRNVEQGLNNLMLDSPEKPIAVEEHNRESVMMEKLSKITQEVLKKESSFEAEEDVGLPPRCQSSMGMIEKSINLHEETKKLLEETSPRKSDEVMSFGHEDREDSIPALVEEEEDILYAESTIDPLPETSEMSEVVTQDVTESQAPLDYVQNVSALPEPQQPLEVKESPEHVPTNESQPIVPAEEFPQDVQQMPQEYSQDKIAQDPSLVEGYQQYENYEYQQEPQQYEPQTQEPQHYEPQQQEQPQQQEVLVAEQNNSNMYGNVESSESTNHQSSIGPPIQQIEQPQALDNAGFVEYELQQNTPEYQDEVETLAEYDSSEMTATSIGQQPVQQVADYDVQSMSQTSTSDEVEQQIADIMKHAPTDALPPAPPGRTGASPTSSWGKVKNVTGALRTKPVSPTSSRAGSAKSSPGSKKSITPPNKSPSSRSPNSSSGTRSPATKKPSPPSKK